MCEYEKIRVWTKSHKVNTSRDLFLTCMQKIFSHNFKDESTLRTRKGKTNFLTYLGYQILHGPKYPSGPDQCLCYTVTCVPSLAQSAKSLDAPKGPSPSHQVYTLSSHHTMIIISHYGSQM
jgi:hypothetical protein